MLNGMRRYLGDPVAAWRTGTPQSQVLTLVLLLVGVCLCFAVSVLNYALMPLTSFYVWLLLGMLLLRFRQLIVMSAVTTVAALSAMLLDPPLTATRVTAALTMLLSLVLILFASSRQQSGLPGPMGEALLSDLRRRLQSQGTIPDLPAGWSSESSMVAADGGGYGGDFLVARLGDDEDTLELILVDVRGKGISAASRALQFGGALGGLIGALPPRKLFRAANTFLLRQSSDETFATAVHVVVDLHTGVYHLTSAGHPPALRWREDRGTWETETATGTALGILPVPELDPVSGVLEPGDALMFYTDGVIETPGMDLDDGIAWLQGEAVAAVGPGFAGASARILERVDRLDDDRAVLILQRLATPGPVPPEAVTDSSPLPRSVL